MRGHNNHSGAGVADTGLVADAGTRSCIFGDLVYSLSLIGGIMKIYVVKLPRFISNIISKLRRW